MYVIRDYQDERMKNILCYSILRAYQGYCEKYRIESDFKQLRINYKADELIDYGNTWFISVDSVLNSNKLMRIADRNAIFIEDIHGNVVFQDTMKMYIYEGDLSNA